MNGRMYDTDLRRFLSPDNYVQDPTNTQNYNRYQYGYNNPLKYSDPSGEFLGALIFIGLTFLKGALIRGAAYAIFAGKHFTWRGLGNAALWGGIGAVVSAGIGAATKALAGILSTGNSLVVQAFNVGAHFAVGGLLTSLQGGNFLSGGLSDSFSAIVGFKAGALTRNASKFVKKVAYYVSGALSGGVGSLLGHGSFGSGAARGTIVTGLNHLAHLVEKGLGNTQPKDPPEWDLDGDGKLSLKEANNWYRNGGGKAITVPAGSVDLDFVDPSKWTKNQQMPVQTLLKSSSGLVYGHLTLVYKGNNQFQILPDHYDFKMFEGGYSFRNFATRIGHIVAGAGIPFKINFSGLNTVDYRPFTPKFQHGYKGF